MPNESAPIASPPPSYGAVVGTRANSQSVVAKAVRKYSDGVVALVTEDGQEIVIEGGDEVEEVAGPGASIPASSFNVLNTMIGGGTVAMPYAFFEAGWGLGAGMLVLFAVLSAYTQNLLIHTDNIVTRRGGKNGSYENLGEAAFGKVGTLWVQWVELLNTFGVLATYLVIIRDQSKIFDLWVDSNSILLRDDHFYFLLLTTIVLIIPLSMFPKLTWIVYASIPSLLCILYTGIVVTIKGIYTVATETHHDPWVVANPSGILLSMPILTIAFTSHINVFHVYRELRDKSEERMLIVSNISMAAGFMFYVFVGLGGYLMFVDHTNGDILKNYAPAFLPGQIARALMFVSFVLTYPILCFPCRHALHSLVVGRHGPHDGHTAVGSGSGSVSIESDGEGDDPHVALTSNNEFNTINADGVVEDGSESGDVAYPEDDVCTSKFLVPHVIETLCIIGGSFTVASLVPSVVTIFSLVGAITATNLVFIMPTAFYLKLNSEGFTSRMVGSVFILIIGVGAMIGSTTAIAIGIRNGNAA